MVKNLYRAAALIMIIVLIIITGCTSARDAPTPHPNPDGVYKHKAPTQEYIVSGDGFYVKTNKFEFNFDNNCVETDKAIFCGTFHIKKL